jgi:hypothetical protein
MNKSIIIIFVVVIVGWSLMMFMNRDISSTDLLDACVKFLQKNAKNQEELI